MPVFSAADHKFYYVKDMDVDDALMFKCYDSRGSFTRFTPHTGFVDPRPPADAPPRESIEIRAYVFWENEPSQEPDLKL